MEDLFDILENEDFDTEYELIENELLSDECELFEDY